MLYFSRSVFVHGLIYIFAFCTCVTVSTALPRRPSLLPGVAVSFTAPSIWPRDAPGFAAGCLPWHVDGHKYSYICLHCGQILTDPASRLDPLFHLPLLPAHLVKILISYSLTFCLYFKFRIAFSLRDLIKCFTRHERVWHSFPGNK